MLDYLIIEKFMAINFGMSFYWFWFMLHAPRAVSALIVLYNSFNSAPQLTGWTSNGSDPCSQSWKGITCSGSEVIEMWAAVSCKYMLSKFLKYYGPWWYLNMILCCRLNQQIAGSTTYWVFGLHAVQHDLNGWDVRPMVLLQMFLLVVTLCWCWLFYFLRLVKWLEQQQSWRGNRIPYNLPPNLQSL